MKQPILALFFASILLAMTSSTINAQCLETEDQRVSAPGPIGGTDSYDHFGFAVSLSNSLALVGIPRQDTALAYGAGSVQVFRFDGLQWVEEEKLIAADGALEDRFGNSLATSGGAVIVGTPNDDDVAGPDVGSAYVFRFGGTQWVQEQKLTAMSGVAYDRFGRSVAMSGDVVLVGAPQDGIAAGPPGCAYVFRFNGSQWVQQQRLTASDGANGDNFGHSIALEGDVALIGSSWDDTGGHSYGGSVYAFRFNGIQWVQTQKLTPSDASSGDQFGVSVALSGDVALIGAYLASGLNNGPGAAYVFRLQGTVWLEEQKLTPSDGISGADNRFGCSVAIANDLALVGSQKKDHPGGTDAGSAYVFRHDGNQWQEWQQILASDSEEDDEFGNAVSIDGDTVLVGAHHSDTFVPYGGSCCNYEETGSAYFFTFRDLALHASANTVQPGDTLGLTTCGGLQGALGLLSLARVNGPPFPTILSIGPFDSLGQLDLTATVPNIYGYTADFVALGFYQSGKIGQSRLETVVFQ